MKKRDRFMIKSLLSLYVCITLLSLCSCSTIKQQLANKDDIVVAQKLPYPYVETYAFTDLYALAHILTDRLEKYRLGLAALKKEGATPIEESVTFEVHLNLLETMIKNLSLYLEEDWKEQKTVLKQELDLIQNLFQNLSKKNDSPLTKK